MAKTIHQLPPKTGLGGAICLGGALGFWCFWFVSFLFGPVLVWFQYFFDVGGWGGLQVLWFCSTS